jgi:hypothetical protein
MMACFSSIFTGNRITALAVCLAWSATVVRSQNPEPLFESGDLGGYRIVVEATGPDTAVEYPKGSGNEIVVFGEHDGFLEYAAIERLMLSRKQALAIQLAARDFRKKLAQMAKEHTTTARRK